MKKVIVSLILTATLCLNSVIPAFAEEIVPESVSEDIIVEETVEEPTEDLEENREENSEENLEENSIEDINDDINNQDSVSADDIVEEENEVEAEDLSSGMVVEESTSVVGGDLPDNDVLFAEYVDNAFSNLWGDEAEIASLHEGEKLTGQNKIVYDEMVKHIKAVANGEKNTGICEIKPSVLLSKEPVDGKIKLTAAEIGVDTIVKNGDVNPDVWEKLYPFSTREVLNALFADYPYELYWYDKTKGMNTSMPGFSYNSSYITIDDSNPIVLKMCVSYDYTVGNYVGSTKVDTSKTGATKAAVTNAKSIVQAAASKSDYDKLDYYRDWICGHNTYNHYAADNDIPYGDPWQVIYVFDGKDDTNVVCEGYSKSFQYLCDNTQFDSTDIYCICAEGTGYNSGGYGPHMWNIMHMDDGYNYHTDITWCDSDGKDDERDFFLIGALKQGSTVNEYYYINNNNHYTYDTKDNSIMSLYTAAQKAIRIGANYEPPSGIVVAFDPNASGVTAPASIRVEKDGTYGTLPTLTRTGYSFDGWYTAASGGIEVTSSTVVTATEGHTLYAHWTAAQYTITFGANGGILDSAQTSKKVTYDATYGALPTPTRTGYGFAGWYTAASGGTKIESTTKVTTADSHTLYAHWTAAQYTVTFDANSGTVTTASKKVNYDATYGTLPTPTKTGYRFDGWYTAASGGTKIESTTKVTTAEGHTLYAHWTAAEYTVKFNANGGTVTTASKPVTYDSTYGELPVPVREGYNFSGWYTAASGGTKIEADTVVSITAEQTLYARWLGAEYTVTFDPNGGTIDSALASKKVNNEAPYGELPTPERVGYRFVGWYSDKTDGSQVKSDTIAAITKDRTLYAHWTAEEYTVTFDANGGMIDSAQASKKITFDATYGALPTPTKTGYRFNGWYTAKTDGTKIESTTVVAITESQILYAHWTAEEYTVTFNANGGTLDSAQASKKITFDSTYGSLPTPERYGYNFSGWYTAATDGTKIESTTKVTIADNHEIYAHWSPIESVVTFDPNGGTVDENSKTVKYDDSYGQMPTPVRAGYIFAGWYTDATAGEKISADTKVTIVTSRTLYAHWTAIEIGLTFNPNGGTVATTSKTVTYDSTYGELPVPTKKGYQFDGWYTAKTDGTKIESTTLVAITEKQTLYAHWSPLSITVSLDACEGSVDPISVSVVYDGVYGELPVPTRDGYLFKGWYTAKDGGLQIEADTAVTVTENQTLYARWAKENGFHPISVEDCEVKLSKTVYEYTGSVICPSVSVKYGYTNGSKTSYATLNPGVDYILTYDNNIDAGTALIRIKGIGDYCGTKDISFTISQKSIAKATIVGPTQMTYTDSFASDLKDKIQVYDGVLKVDSREYELIYDAANLGTTDRKLEICVKAVAGANYKDLVKKNFSLLVLEEGTMKTSLDGAELIMPPSKTYTYNGKLQKPKPVVKLSGATVSSKNYTLMYENNLHAGIAYVYAVGKGNYAGMTAKCEFTILPKPASKLKVDKIKKVGYRDFWDVKVAVKDGKTYLKEDTHYKLTFDTASLDLAGMKSKKVRYTITALPDTDYEGYLTGYVTIVPRNISTKYKVQITCAESCPLVNGVAVPNIEVRYEGVLLEEQKDYEVAFKNNTKSGKTATATIKGLGNYTGKLSVKFKVE